MMFTARSPGISMPRVCRNECAMIAFITEIQEQPDNRGGGACLKWEVDGFGRIHPAKQVQFAGISWLMPSVKSHHARLCNHPVDNARFMGFLAYGVACSAL